MPYVECIMLVCDASLSNISVQFSDVTLLWLLLLMANGVQTIEPPPPSWICLGHIWTADKEYLRVSISLQNLVMINAVVFMI